MFFVVTRYAPPHRKRIVRHVYGQNDGSPFPTRGKAQAAVDRMIREAERGYYISDDDWKYLEINIVRLSVESNDS